MEAGRIRLSMARLRMRSTNAEDQPTKGRATNHDPGGRARVRARRRKQPFAADEVQA